MTRLRWKPEERALGILIVLAAVMAMVSLAGWITHIVICVKDGQWLLLIAGAVAFPVGVIHGSGHWFGVWSSPRYFQVRPCRRPFQHISAPK